MGPPTCDACRWSPPPWSRARAVLRYDQQAKRLVLPLKYGDRVDLARALAPRMARAGAILLRDADVLVPVPLHRRRRVARRYNQAALLASALGRVAGRPVLVDALRRTRATAPLGGLGSLDREAELEDAITANPRRAHAVAGRRVLLVDDVLTSGATGGACTGALLEAGAADVDVLVVARVGVAERESPSGADARLA